MAIRGSLGEASLPDVLQLLALGQKTGRLSVTDRARLGQIYFDRGAICFASIVNRRDRLGDLLVKNGVVPPDLLADALEAQGAGEGEGRRLGEILIARGALTRAMLERYIRLQIEEAVYFLFTWTQGSFTFEAGERPEEGEMLVSISPESVLLEGARRVDEWALIEKKIPSLDLVFAVDGAAGAAAEGLTPEQRRVLPLLDGRRSVREVVEEAGMVEFDAAKAVFGLVQAGLARAAGRRAAPAARPSAERLQEHRNLAVAFYQSQMLDEAAREFSRVLELQPAHLEARFHLGLIALRQGDDRAAVRQLMRLIERGGRWGAAFHNLALALERLGRPDDALAAVEEALRAYPGNARILLSHAILLLKTGDAGRAAEAFTRYRAALGPAARPPAAYYAFALLAEAACGRRERARRLGDGGMTLYPHSAAVALHYGLVQERAGVLDAAELLYRRAVEESPELAQAHKSLGDVLFRGGRGAEAAEAYRRAVELDPALGDDAHFKLGLLAYRGGERAEAVRHWRATLELNPDHDLARTNLELVAGTLTES